MDTDHYRGDLTAARLRIEQLEAELAVFRADPAYERVDIAEERLVQARARRERISKWLPRAAIASFAAMAGFALTQPDWPEPIRMLGYALFILGALGAPVTIAALLRRPKDLTDLERDVRIAKGDIGARQLLRSPDEIPLLEGPKVESSLPSSLDTARAPRSIA